MTSSVEVILCGVLAIVLQSADAIYWHYDHQPDPSSAAGRSAQAPSMAGDFSDYGNGPAPSRFRMRAAAPNQLSPGYSGEMGDVGQQAASQQMADPMLASGGLAQDPFAYQNQPSPGGASPMYFRPDSPGMLPASPGQDVMAQEADMYANAAIGQQQAYQQEVAPMLDMANLYAQQQQGDPAAMQQQQGRGGQSSDPYNRQNINGGSGNFAPQPVFRPMGVRNEDPSLQYANAFGANNQQRQEAMQEMLNAEQQQQQQPGGQQQNSQLMPVEMGAVGGPSNQLMASNPGKENWHGWDSSYYPYYYGHHGYPYYPYWDWGWGGHHW